MGHIAYIRYYGLTSDILTYRKCQIGLAVPELVGIYEVSEQYRCAFLVWNFYSDSRLTRYGSFYSDLRCCQGKLYIVT
jgi:hypothetical protein